MRVARDVMYKNSIKLNAYETLVHGKQVCVVFGHGILSSGEACWTNRTSVFWPKLLADDDTANALAVYSFTDQNSLRRNPQPHAGSS